MKNREIFNSDLSQTDRTMFSVDFRTDITS